MITQTLAGWSFVHFGPTVISQRPGSGLESFLEVFCFNLTERQLVRSHSVPIWTHMGIHTSFPCCVRSRFFPEKVTYSAGNYSAENLPAENYSPDNYVAENHTAENYSTARPLIKGLEP